MTKETLRWTRKDQRHFARAPFAGTISYCYGHSETGQATCLDVGHGGARLILGRYLRPGRHVLLALALDSEGEKLVELKARVAWCRPAGEPHTFIAGVYIFHDEPEVSAALSELLYEALRRLGWVQPVAASAFARPAVTGRLACPA